jgi:hypothetical protein
MKTLTFVIGAAASLFAGSLCACMYTPIDDATGGAESAVEEVDPLEGAYEKQGGTEVHFVFKRGAENEDDTFFGEIDVNGSPARADGKIAVTRDKLGTKFTLTPSGGAAKPKGDSGTRPPSTSTDAGKEGGAATADAGPPPDNRTLAQQAFSGTMHFLKIGKNSTILVRGDENGKTAHYKKIKNWCGTGGDDDCDSSVQNTGLECGSKEAICTSKNTCACGK